MFGLSGKQILALVVVGVLVDIATNAIEPRVYSLFPKLGTGDFNPGGGQQ